MLHVRLGFLFLFCVLAAEYSECSEFLHTLSSAHNDVEVVVEANECEFVGFQIVRDSTPVFLSSLGHSAPFTSVVRTSDNEMVLMSQKDKIVLTIEEDSPGIFLMRVSRKNIPASETLMDCISLGSHAVHWYGGPQQKYQYWPVEKLNLSDYSYVTKEADNAAVAERYWLNSLGAFIHLSERIPLFIDQNNKYTDQLCFIAKQTLPYNTRVPTYDFEYVIGVANDARDAHLQAVERFLGKPRGVPDARMVARPIWSTWARYKRDIDSDVVLDFAREIVKNDFTNSQFEIDDDWEICYGALTFRTSKFSKIKQTVDDLKNMGFRVTLWIHPFINKACSPYYENALANRYLVLDHNNKADTEWWNSGKGEAAYIDFTNPEAAAWFKQRLQELQQETGIDSFKFDAGETSWQPDDPRLTIDLHSSPLKMTTDYINTVASFGPIVEVRSGFQNQFHDIYMRMIDKDSLWSWNNGLPTLVTTLLQLNMNGYPFVLPDMIGGNGYDEMPSREMFIRWLQANVFMPSLQFSYVPWDYKDGDGINMLDLCRHFVQLHEDYADVIVDRFHLAVELGEPVNPPIWWLDPEDSVALATFDEFLLGDEILSAPVLEEGQTTRDIYLPVGKWQDGNNGTIYQGPQWLRNYPAPLSVLPYFIHLK
ncbi:myogenesis-regulating glycosidase [Phlebotomus argentipes]|uniref:myogenesis-regulating glycosidase n=1 Tax=Phlebotomus argentipes TaxID=94469 RepID=UPI0028930564|nr:myogenesis-regulating glycosidase [Phlebotomus argentipes]